MVFFILECTGLPGGEPEDGGTAEAAMSDKNRTCLGKGFGLARTGLYGRRQHV